MRNKYVEGVVYSFVFLLIVIIASAPSSALENEVVIKQVTDFDLKRPCFNNGTFCTGSATCNLTITKPDGDALVGGLLMTNKGTFHNFTLSKAQTSNVGTHFAIMSCTDGTLSGEDTFNILVSPSGNDDNSISNIILLSFGFIFSAGLILFGFNREDGFMVMFGALGLSLLGLFVLLNGAGNYRNDLTEGLSLLILGVAGYISIRTGMELMNEGL